jgi:energy-converting hydrogenase B subunit B
MSILLISQYILVVALIVFLIAAIRITTRSTIAMGLIGSATFSLGLAVLLLVVGEIYTIQFTKDIALALLILGVVGTIAFSIALRRGKHE